MKNKSKFSIVNVEESEENRLAMNVYFNIHTKDYNGVTIVLKNFIISCTDIDCSKVRVDYVIDVIGQKGKKILPDLYENCRAIADIISRTIFERIREAPHLITSVNDLTPETKTKVEFLKNTTRTLYLDNEYFDESEFKNAILNVQGSAFPQLEVKKNNGVWEVTWFEESIDDFFTAVYTAN